MKSCNEIRKTIVNTVFIALFVFLILLIFQGQTEFVYDFKTQNCLMIALIIIICLKYYRNYYKFDVYILFILFEICLVINLTGEHITDKYVYVGIKALWDNYYLTLIVSAISIVLSRIIIPCIDSVFRNKNRGISVYCEEIMNDKKLYDSHKHDAVYICKFIFESRLRTLGVSGRYGMGKTVIMKEIIGITGSIRNIYVTISPLSCNIEEIPTYIVGQIEKVLKDRGIYTNNTRQITNTIQNGYLSSMINVVSGNQTISDLYKNLRKSICELDIKLTIIVDDLDRIYDKKQMQAIFIILDSIISDNCKVIYLYDSSNLNKVFGKEEGIKYIEKYIQDEYKLKEPTFRDLVKIENDDYIKNNKGSLNQEIYRIIDNERNSIEFGTRIYKYSGVDLKFDIYKLTPRNINKIIKMTYEKLSDEDYFKAVKGFERFVFRYYVFEFYYPDLIHQIRDMKDPSLYFRFNYNEENMTLEQVLAEFFNVGVYVVEDPPIRKKQEKYDKFIHIKNNADKLLALNLLGYSIEIFIKHIWEESNKGKALDKINQREQVYNRLFRIVNKDDGLYRNEHYNNKIAAIISSLINESCSEYTDDEWFVKCFKENVLDKVDILDSYNKYTFKKYKDNEETINIMGQDEITSIFYSFKSGNPKKSYWINMMQLYFNYLIKNDKIIFNDTILHNIYLFRFASYRAGIQACKIISKFDFSDSSNNYLDVIFIPKNVELIKRFIESYFGITIVFDYPIQEEYVEKEDIDECKKYLPTLKENIKRIINRLDDIDCNIKNKLREDICYICEALEKLIELIDNSGNYKDTLDRNPIKITSRLVPRDISKYKGKSKEEIDKMFDEDLDNDVLIPTDYNRIMEQFNRDNEEEQNDNL